VTTYIVDIDNTIFDTPFSEYEKAVPLYKRIAQINALYRAGERIVYYTGRGSKSGKDWKDLTEKQLSQAGALYDELIMGKPAYDIWVDDKSIHPDKFFN